MFQVHLGRVMVPLLFFIALLEIFSLPHGLHAEPEGANPVPAGTNIIIDPAPAPSSSPAIAPLRQVRMSSPNRMGDKISVMDLFATAIYGLLGIGLSMLGYKIFGWISPYSVNKEIADDQNIALGIILGAMFIGVSIIIAAAIIA